MPGKDGKLEYDGVRNKRSCLSLEKADSLTNKLNNYKNRKDARLKGKHGWVIDKIFANENNLFNIYKEAEGKTNVPWEMIAAIHYRENSLNSRVSNRGGPFQFDPPKKGCVESVRDAAICAGRFIKENKCYSKKFNCYGINSETSDEVKIKDAFWGYNGRVYGRADKSPYVMNWHYGDKNPQLNIRGTIDGGAYINRPDRNIGAYRIFLEFKKLGL